MGGQLRPLRSHGRSFEISSELPSAVTPVKLSSSSDFGDIDFDL
jgi:hypothetical protein